jgi:hypothetical protein
VHCPFPYDVCPTTTARSWSCSAPRDDLGRGRRVFVDEHDDRQIGPWLRIAVPELAVRLANAAAHAHDRLVAIQEEVRHPDALRQQPARIRAQIEHQRTHARLGERIDRSGELLLVESLKTSRSTYPTASGNSSDRPTALRWISCLTSDTGRRVPARSVTIAMDVPGAPRNATRVSSMVQSLADFPATSTMRSPVSMPARSAGDPAAGTPR